MLAIRDGVAVLPSTGRQRQRTETAVAGQFRRALQAVRTDDAAHAVLLKGNGWLFCADGDRKRCTQRPTRGPSCGNSLTDADTRTPCSMRLRLLPHS